LTVSISAVVASRRPGNGKKTVSCPRKALVQGRVSGDFAPAYLEQGQVGSRPLLACLLDLDVAAFERLVARGVSIADQDSVDVCAGPGLGFVTDADPEDERSAAVDVP
jgi:hypothetical protein